MSFSDDRDTAQLISTADTDTICVFIDNGRVVNSSGRPRQLAMELDPQQPGPQQLEAVWSLVTSLAQMTEDMERLREACTVVSTKISALEHRVTTKTGQAAAKPVQLAEYSRVITPLAARPGDIGNKVINNTASMASSGIAPVEDNKYAVSDLATSTRLLDKSYSTLNDDHSSLMTRSLVSATASDKPDPIHIIKSKLMNKRVTLNVGGERQEVLWKTLEHMPQSRLGNLAAASTDESIMHCVDFYSLVDNEFFFDRHPRSFLAILNFFRTGRLHIVDEMCVVAFNDDLEYWGVNPLWLENCCQNKFLTRKEHIEDEMQKDASLLKKEADEYWGEGCCARSQQFLWDLFEKPESSLAAKVISWVSVLFVIISTVAMVLNTVPELAGPRDTSGQPTDNSVLSALETVCILWFTLEYCLRFLGAPRKRAFLADLMNIIDVLAILPYFVSLAVVQISASTGQGDSFTEVRQLVSVFRLMRILRIFKLARHSAGLQSIAYTLKNSYKVKVK